MSTIKRALVSSTIGLFVMAATPGNVYSAPDGHEQAAQLLQRSAAKAEPRPTIVVVRPIAQDGREQARRMIQGRGGVGQESRTQHQAGRLVVESTPAVDGQTAARNLLARPLGKKTDATGTGRIAAGVKTRSVDAAK